MGNDKFHGSEQQKPFRFRISSIRVSGVVFLIKSFTIVIACKLENISAFLTVLPLHIVRAECDIAVALRVMKFHKPFEPCRYLLTSLVSVSVKISFPTLQPMIEGRFLSRRTHEATSFSTHSSKI